ncbi:MAG: CoB--CoM heterodisulfide reductase iron-sulfur subunit A family protein [Candidatus Thorarchaeota archaeon]|nr:CoB--CoM heterodisulfide reductase iron-sulfur subunit A family protein [Candidatus Thorarchaeota archaeon]
MSDPVLIIGAGVAGLTAAVELADSGVNTIVVEKLPTVGGNALDLYKAFPTDDCFYCFEGNRWRPGIRKCFYRSALIDQPNMDLKINSYVEQITGNSGKFEATIHVGPEYIDAKKCIMCGLCIEYSSAFSLVSPQCQPQAVTYDPDKADEGDKKAAEECPTKAINLDAQPKKETVSVSDVVIATGYHEMKPVNVDEYSYGKHPNIVTQLELAQILDPIGATDGKLLRPSDGKPAKRVMMVQCVGSRDENYYPYCSKICCVYALKHANILTEERDASQVSVVYMDIRTYDSHERYYREARENGVEFVRGRVARVEPKDENELDIIVYDSLLDKYLKFTVDLFVLSSALEPPEGMDNIIDSLGLNVASGFIAPADLVSENEVVAGDHIYACGTALGPAEVPESVTQARAVASKILQNRK